MITEKDLTQKQKQDIVDKWAKQAKANGASDEVIAHFNKFDKIAIGTSEELEQAHNEWIQSPIVITDEIMKLIESQ